MQDLCRLANRVPSGDVRRQHLKLTRRKLSDGNGVTGFRPVPTATPARSLADFCRTHDRPRNRLLTRNEVEKRDGPTGLCPDRTVTISDDSAIGQFARLLRIQTVRLWLSSGASSVRTRSRSLSPSRSP